MELDLSCVKMPNKTYPDVITCDGLYCYDVVELFDDLTEATKRVDRTRGQIYTQVDGDVDIVYSKGNHLVNRTGVYVVVK